jgi:hypothetical protein
MLRASSAMLLIQSILPEAHRTTYALNSLVGAGGA